MSFIRILTPVLISVITWFIIRPIYNYKKTVKEIAYSLSFYANVYANPSVSEKREKDRISNILRKLGATIGSSSQGILFHKLFSILRILPSVVSIRNAESALIGLSNALYHPELVLLIQKYVMTIRTNLRIDKQ